MPVMDVKLSGGGKYLYAATFGRKRVAAGLSTGATAGGASATVPATPALTPGASASFGAFAPGVASDSTATTTANVISSAARPSRSAGRRPRC
jgi:hypothetical protein